MEVKALRLFRDKVNEVIQNRKDINELLKNEQVLKYLRLTNGSIKEESTENIREIIAELLPGFIVKKSNGIYVCVSAFCYGIRSSAQFYCKPSFDADLKNYKDIETGDVVHAGILRHGCEIGIEEFEAKNTVLNPYDTLANDPNYIDNGYLQVRQDFFEACYRQTQPKAVAMIKGKYPSIGNRSGRA